MPTATTHTLASAARTLLLATFCWLAMMWVHECGHVLGCILSGGKIDHVVLAPWSFSRTDPFSDPHPLVTVWSGPLFGSLFPLVLSLCFPRIALLRLFAAFCLLVNGIYICCASFTPFADAAVMLRRGSPMWTLWGFGIVAFGVSLPLLRSLGPRLSLDKRPSPYGPAQILIAIFLTLGMAVAGALFFRDSL
jgi:hypothetical protein